MNLLANLFYRDCLQVLPEARAGHAFAGFDDKKGAVCRALDETAVSVEKLVWQPVEFNAQMRALIKISEDLILLPNDENGALTDNK